MVGKKDNDVPGCSSVKTIDEIKTDATIKYVRDLTSKIDLIKGGQTVTHITDNSRTYELVNQSLKYNNDTIEIERKY